MKPRMALLALVPVVGRLGSLVLADRQGAARRLRGCNCRRLRRERRADACGLAFL